MLMLSITLPLLAQKNKKQKKTPLKTLAELTERDGAAAMMALSSSATAAYGPIWAFGFSAEVKNLSTLLRSLRS